MHLSQWPGQLVKLTCGAPGRLLAVVLVLLGSLLGVRAVIASNDANANSPVYENLERNQIASALYAQLATLPQPVTISAVARILNSFTQDESRIAGATLVDMQGQLLVQVGAGNETLALGSLPVKSGYVPTALVPVTSEDQPFANAIITFRETDAASSAWLLFTLAAIVTLMMSAFAYVEWRNYSPLKLRH